MPSHCFLGVHGERRYASHIIGCSCREYGLPLVKVFLRSRGDSRVTLAQIISELIAEQESLAGKRLSYNALSAACHGAISASYMWRLRTGAIRDPSLSTLEALGRLFGKPICVFSTDERRMGDGRHGLMHTHDR
jgi:hypothetical protein